MAAPGDGQRQPAGQSRRLPTVVLATDVGSQWVDAEEERRPQVGSNERGRRILTERSWLPLLATRALLRAASLPEQQVEASPVR